MRLFVVKVDTVTYRIYFSTDSVSVMFFLYQLLLLNVNTAGLLKAAVRATLNLRTP